MLTLTKRTAGHTVSETIEGPSEEVTAKIEELQRIYPVFPYGTTVSRSDSGDRSLATVEHDDNCD